MHDRDVIIIGSVDWSVHRQTNHRLATELAAAGNRVLFVENTGVRSPRWGDMWRIRERLRNWRKSTNGFAEVTPNITIVSPLLIPLPYNVAARAINGFLLGRALRRWMRVSHFSETIFITFLPTPLVHTLIATLNPAIVIYYCANDMANAFPPAPRLRPWEDAMFQKADAVFVISEAIRERAQKFSTHVHSFPAAVEFEKFEQGRLHAEVPADLRALPRPVVGYVGAIGPVLDQDLVVQMARQRPDVSFAFVGPAYVSTRLFESCPNIHLLGARQHDEIPAYMKGFDVGLIPYAKSSFADSVYSCKLNEYLAMGLPVVATDLREIRQFVDQHGPVIEIGAGADDFIAKVGCALKCGGAAAEAERIAVARTNSWSNRFAGLETVIEQRYLERRRETRAWQEALSSMYWRHRLRLLTGAVVLAAAYLLVFQSPLVWLAGEPLTLRQSPKAADAIVVFSGNGDAAYVNPGYQRRALDALKYFRAGYAPLIILSSGKEQTLKEVDIMRAVIEDQGVPRSAIEVVDMYPHNTYENVEIVSRMLEERHAHSILFVTAPYHSRRASLIWSTIAPGVDVRTVPVVDTPPDQPQWTASIEQIRTIAYEYVAIAYNWTRGWLSL